MPARRRALLLVAAGGDPHRELEVDDRAVKSLAADLYSDERREQLGRALDALVSVCATCRSRARPRSSSSADIDLAWRLFALTLLAEELAE